MLARSPGLNKHVRISPDMVLFIQTKIGYILYHEVKTFNFKIIRGINCTDHGLVFSYKGSQTYRLIEVRLIVINVFHGQ